MKVLYYCYPHAFQDKGGGEVLLMKLKEHTAKLGVETKLFDQWNDKLTNYDILHVIGSVKECLPLMETAKRKGVKVALSPIFWSSMNRAVNEYGGPLRKANEVIRHLAKVVFPALPSRRHRMMEISDVLLPNSYAERELLARLFALSKAPMYVVPNGVDERFAHARSELFKDRYKMEGFVLMVGRIEPRKNQFNLIKAVKSSGKKLVLIGDCVSGYEKYLELCKSWGGEDVLFLHNIPHDSEILESAYAACGVFALPSWFETPGLAGLEAGLAGKRIVITNGGCTKEYFKEYAFYVNPGSVRDIRAKITEAFDAPESPALKNHILENYLWEKVARATVEAYGKALEE